MKMERPDASIDFKLAAFKALLKGPAVFAQFSGRFEVSHENIQEWLAEACASLEQASKLKHETGGLEQKKYSDPLIREEREILLGTNKL